MDEFRIGFAGGCINKQPGLDRSDHYYSLLGAKLSAHNPLTDHQVSFITYHSYDQVYERVQQLVDKKNVQAVFLFIRPFPLMPLQKLLIRYDKPGKKKGWALHSGLFSRYLAWDKEFTEFQSADEYQYVERKRFGLRDLNLLAGISLGLHRWAVRYLKERIHRIGSLCAHRDVALYIISPPRNPASIVGDLTCRWVTAALESFCREWRLPFININGLSADKFEKDNIHFNKDGHEAIAHLIYGALIGTDG